MFIHPCKFYQHSNFVQEKIGYFLGKNSFIHLLPEKCLLFLYHLL